MDYINFNNQEKNYKKYFIANITSYLPLIIMNTFICTSIVNLNNLINSQENLDYIHKIKHIIDDICNVINCSESI